MKLLLGPYIEQYPVSCCAYEILIIFGEDEECLSIFINSRRFNISI